MTADAARTRPARGRAVVVLLALAAALLGALWAAAPADAHAVLVSSTPADGSRVESPPAQVVLNFDEHIGLVPGAAKVISSTGARADTGKARLDAAGTGIVLPLKRGLPKGSYTATWRVVSADTHIVSGSITFGIRQNPAAVSGSAAPPVTSLDVVAETAVGLGYLGVILAFGTVFVVLLLWPDRRGSGRLRAMVWSGWALLAAGALLDFLLQGPRATESGWAGVIRLDDVRQTVQSVYGVALLGRLALLLVLLPTGRVLASGSRRARGAVIAASALAVGVLVTIALGGHAAVGADAAIATFAAVLHLASMATWCGGLAALLLVVLPRLADASAAVMTLKRWSLLAFVSVVALIVSGEYQAWRQIQPLPSLWSTSYGITLLIKLALVCAALLAALVAQRALLGHHRIDGETDAAPRVLRAVRRSVRIESAVVVAVVAVTTVLVSQPPASGSYGPAARLTATLGPADTLQVSVNTTRRGPEELTITPKNAAGKTLRVQSLAANLSSSQNGIAALDLKLRRLSDGSWRTTGATLPLPGTWTLTFDVSVDQASGYAAAVDYTVW